MFDFWVYYILTENDLFMSIIGKISTVIFSSNRLPDAPPKKKCSPDNVAGEGFFGRMKTECFYNHSIEELSLDELKTYLSNYIQW